MRGRWRAALASPWRGKGAGTLRDVADVAWGVALLLGIVAGLGWLSREYFGPLAWRVTLGLGAVVLVVLAAIVLANLVAVAAADAWRAVVGRRGRASDSARRQRSPP